MKNLKVLSIACMLFGAFSSVVTEMLQEKQQERVIEEKVNKAMNKKKEEA